MIIPLSPTFPIVTEERTMTSVFKNFALEIHKQSLQIGTGSPEGVLEASKGSEYMDDTGTTGSIKYIKKSEDIAGDRKKGWILV